jgi:fatty acid desaturase
MDPLVLAAFLLLVPFAGYLYYHGRHHVNRVEEYVSAAAKAINLFNR